MLRSLKNFGLKILSNPTYFWIAIILVYILSRIATWCYPFDSDHWIFYYIGKNWIDGGSLYVSAWDHKPPLIFLFNGLMSLICGENIILHRIWLSGLSIIDIFLFYKVLKIVIPSLFEKIKTKINSDIIIKIGLLLYIFLRNLSQFTSSGNNTENYGLIFVLGMWLSYLSFRKDKKWYKILLAGFCCSVLFFLKGNFLLLGLPIGILLLIDNLKSIKNFIGYGFVFVTPIIIQTFAWIWYFSTKGTLNDFWIASFGFSAKYSSSAWNGDLSNNIILLLTTLILIIPAILFFVFYLRDFKLQKNNHEYLLIGLSFLSGIMLTLGIGSFYAYYLEIFMPIIVLVFLYTLTRFNSINKTWKILLILALAASLVLSYGISTKQLYNSFGGSVKTEALQYQEVADYVKKHSTKNDKVFCYDYGATFYQLSNRDSGSRFVSASVLLLDYRDNYGFNFDSTFIKDMDKNKTKYVITYIDRETLYYKNTPIVKYLDNHYVVEKQFDTLEVLRRAD